MTRSRQRRRLRQLAAEKAERIGGQGERPAWERRLEEMAIANGWVGPLTPDVLGGIARRQSMIAIDPKSDPRDASRAAGVVVKIVAQVQQQEDRDAGITGDSTVNVGVQVNQSVASAVGAEPEYLEWLRQRELAQSGDAHAVGSNGFAAKVPDTAPRLGDGSSGH